MRPLVLLALVSPASASIVAPEDAKLVPSGADEDDQVAISVAVLGDVDGDGYGDVALGAQVGDDGVGQVWLFYGAPGGVDPLREDLLLPPQPEPAGRFGSAVADAGDLDGDGFADLAVASDEANEYRGAVDVFYGSATGIDPTRTDRMVAPDGMPGEVFGSSLAGGGDVDGDGYDDLLVGEAGADVDGRSGAGTVYAYFGSPTGIDPTRRQRLVTQSPVANRLLGFDVAIVGDTDGDGYDDIAASAAGLAVDEPVFVWRGSAAGVDEASELELVASNFAMGDSYGMAVAGGDVDGDGYADLVVGAMGRDAGVAEDVGAFYVYRGGPAGIDAATEQFVLPPSARPETRFALALAAGDVDGDGFDDVLLGAPNDTLGFAAGSFGGSVQTFYGSAAGIDLPRAEETLASDTASGDGLGYSIAVGDVDGDGLGDVLVGAPYHDGSGAAYLFLGGACPDADADGSCERDDCDDTRGDVFPGAPEVAGDEVDGDCDGVDECLVDADGDGYARDGATVGSDDIDCDDAGEATLDEPAGDCDDADPTVHPEVADPSGDGVDSDCDGAVEDTDIPGTDEPERADGEETGGCGCANRGGAGTWLGVGLGALLRRRRR